jgi:hypothetical protein
VDLGKTELPDETEYHYVALAECKDHNMYELDGKQLLPVINGCSLKMSYILDDTK